MCFDHVHPPLPTPIPPSHPLPNFIFSLFKKK